MYLLLNLDIRVAHTKVIAGEKHSPWARSITHRLCLRTS
jgi:hypothetical protein